MRGDIPGSRADRKPRANNSLFVGDTRLNGINGGTNGGRSCWTVAGTFCFGEVQGTFARKLDDCMECEFFRVVAEEEEKFTPSVGSMHGYSKP